VKRAFQKVCVERSSLPYVVGDQFFLEDFSWQSIVEHLDDSERLKRSGKFERKFELDVRKSQINRSSEIGFIGFDVRIDFEEIVTA
jgi:hypothetical protein